MKRDYDKFVDAKGLKCPQPLLLVKQGIKAITTNQILMLEATDPHTDLDLEVWCERFGHIIIKQHVDMDTDMDIFRFWIKKT